MKPRWLVIAAVLPTQDVMYVQYNVPTIVMSRSCDQLPKVLPRTSAPPEPLNLTNFWDSNNMSDYIVSAPCNVCIV